MSAPPDRTRFTTHGLQRAAIIALTCTVVWFSMWPSAASLTTIWLAGRERSYGHGMLVVLICLWMVYWRRESLAASEDRASPWLLVPTAIVTILWLIAVRAGLQVVHQALVPILTLLVLAAAWGPALARHLLLPLGTLYFAIPVWDGLTGPLQGATVLANRIILGQADIPHFIAGTTIQIPAGVIEVADSCAGVNFLVVGLCIAIFLGELNRDGWPRRLLIIALAAIYSIVANWIRVAVIIYAAHVTGMQHPLVTEGHYGFGWAVFAATMVVFFITTRYLPLASPSAAATETGTSSATHGPRYPMPFVLAAALALVILGPAASAILDRRTPPPAGTISLPEAPAGWYGPVTGYSDWHPVLRGADAQASGWYRRGDDVVEIFFADYAEQRQGKELSGFDNSIPGAQLEGPLESGRLDLDAMRVNTMIVRDPDGVSWQLWYTYQVGGRSIDSDLAQALWYAIRSLAGPTQSRLVALRSPCRPDCTAAAELLTHFWRQALSAPRGVPGPLQDGPEPASASSRHTSPAVSRAPD